MIKDKSKRQPSSSSSPGKKENKKSKQLFISSNRYVAIVVDDDSELVNYTQNHSKNSSTEQEKNLISTFNNGSRCWRFC